MKENFYAVTNGCERKALSRFEALEERFDSLDDCCHAKFPQSVSDCCKTDCILSGNLKFIPVRISCFGTDVLATFETILNQKYFLCIARNGTIKSATLKTKICCQVGNVHLPRVI